MPRDQQTTPEIQWAIIRLSKVLDHENIASCLNMPTRTVKRIISYFRRHGTVPNPGDHSTQEERTGNRHLRDVEVEACCQNQLTPRLRD